MCPAPRAKPAFSISPSSQNKKKKICSAPCYCTDSHMASFLCFKSKQFQPSVFSSGLKQAPKAMLWRHPSKQTQLKVGSKCFFGFGGAFFQHCAISRELVGRGKKRNVTWKRILLSMFFQQREDMPPSYRCHTVNI